MRHLASTDDPTIPQISYKEILVAWGLLGLIAVYYFAIGPSCPRSEAPTPTTLAADIAAPAAPAALGEFENEADRAAALAGLGNESAETVAQISRPVLRPSERHVETCQLPLHSGTQSRHDG